jgi:hypothetical protein
MAGMGSAVGVAIVAEGVATGLVVIVGVGLSAKLGVVPAIKKSAAAKAAR